MEIKTAEYNSLNAISTVLKYLGYFIIIISAVGLLVALLNDSLDTPTTTMLVILSLIAGPFSAMIMIAFAEIIRVLIKIENNTRGALPELPITKATFERTSDTKTFDEWKKRNPTKTRNDYYAAIRKNNR